MVINIDEIEIGLIDEIEEIKKIVKTLDNLEKVSKKYDKYAQMFDFTTWEDDVEFINNGVEINTCKNTFMAYLTNLRDHLQKIYSYDMSTQKDITKIQAILKNYALFKNGSQITLDSVKQLVEIIDESYLVENYVQCLNYQFTKLLDEKVKQIIADDQLNQLDEEKHSVEDVKINIIGRLTGKKKLKDLVLENIDLKKESVMSDINTFSLYKPLNQIIKNITDYIENKNISNPNIFKLNEILENINQTELIKLLNDEHLSEFEKSKSKVYTVVKYKDDSISTKEKIEYFTSNNIELKKNNTKSRMKGLTQQTKHGLEYVKKPIYRFFNCINSI